MAQLAQLRNSILIAILVCSCAEQQKPIIAERISSADTSLKMVNGIVYRSNKLFTGTIYKLYLNTTDTAELANYKNGKEDGEWKKFDPDGSLKEKRTFDKGKKVGEYIAYWENGNRKLEYVFKDDEYEGTCREWNADGALIKEMNYKKGHEDGSQKMFYDNGKVRSNYVMIDGRRFGLLGTKNCVNVSDSIFKK